VAGAMAAALVSMVAKLTVVKAKDKDKGKEFEEIEERAERLRKELLLLADEDCQAFERVMQAYRTKKEEPGRLRKIQKALEEASQVPLETAEKSVVVVKLASDCVREGNQNAVSDARVALELATAAVYGALENVRINLESIKDSKFGEEIKEKIDNLLECQDLKAG
jgi:formiminotetrahydrofolate cyclodeaminase